MFYLRRKKMFLIIALTCLIVLTGCHGSTNDNRYISYKEFQSLNVGDRFLINNFEKLTCTKAADDYFLVYADSVYDNALYLYKAGTEIEFSNIDKNKYCFFGNYNYYSVDDSSIQFRRLDDCIFDIYYFDNDECATTVSPVYNQTNHIFVENRDSYCFEPFTYEFDIKVIGNADACKKVIKQIASLKDIDNISMVQYDDYVYCYGTASGRYDKNCDIVVNGDGSLSLKLLEDEKLSEKYSVKVIVNTYNRIKHEYSRFVIDNGKTIEDFKYYVDDDISRLKQVKEYIAIKMGNTYVD